VAPDGTQTIVADCGGGPNGAALGPDGKMYICNNGGFVWSKIGAFNRPGETLPEDYEGGSIQSVDLETGEVCTVFKECEGESLKGPNDIVFDRQGGFYFTDLGKRRGRQIDRGAIFYAKVDGSMIVELVHPFDTPNGIGLSPDEKTLYVAETNAARLWAFDIESPGVLKKNGPSPFWPGRLLHKFYGYERLDSLAVDSEGNVVVATLGTGCVTAIAPSGEVRARVPVPDFDLMVTNVCFGGPDLKTAFVTSSGLGRLYSFQWHCPGLPLNFLNI
jgi:gluconolactonase